MPSSIPFTVRCDPLPLRSASSGHNRELNLKRPAALFCASSFVLWTNIKSVMLHCCVIGLSCCCLAHLPNVRGPCAHSPFTASHPSVRRLRIRRALSTGKNHLLKLRTSSPTAGRPGACTAVVLLNCVFHHLFFFFSLFYFSQIHNFHFLITLLQRNHGSKKRPRGTTLHRCRKVLIGVDVDPIAPALSRQSPRSSHPSGSDHHHGELGQCQPSVRGQS